MCVWLALAGLDSPKSLARTAMLVENAGHGNHTPRIHWNRFVGAGWRGTACSSGIFPPAHRILYIGMSRLAMEQDTRLRCRPRVQRNRVTWAGRQYESTHAPGVCSIANGPD